MRWATKIVAGSGDIGLARFRLGQEAAKTIIWFTWRNGSIARVSPISQMRSRRFLRSLPERWRSQGATVNPQQLHECFGRLSDLNRRGPLLWRSSLLTAVSLTYPQLSKRW